MSRTSIAFVTGSHEKRRHGLAANASCANDWAGLVKVVVIGGWAPSLINFRGPLVRDLVNRGHEVVCCAPERDHEVEEKLRALGARYIPIPLATTSLSPRQDLRTLASLTRLLRRLAPDVLLAYTAKPVIYGCLAGSLARVPKIYALVTGLGTAFGEGRGLRQSLVARVVSGLYRVSLGHASTVIFQNRDDPVDLLKAGVLSPQTAVKVVNGSGVDLEHFAVAAAPPPPIRFLLVGRVLSAKGVREFVEAARVVRHEDPRARFDLLGWTVPGPEGIPAHELQAWQDEGVVRHLGAAKDVRPFLAEASVFVLPSWYREGTPRSILEAMAVGRPIVTTDMPGCRETVVSGRNGFLIPPRDAPALASALLRFIEDPGLVERFGAESRKIAEERYDVHAVNAEMLETMGLG